MERLKQTPKISVIIPNYNRTLVLQRAIQSAIRQNYSNMEVIVVDDASSVDPSKYIYSFDDDRIKLVRLSKNGGAAKARNHGVTVAKGTYIAFLDSDDEWLPNYLERRVKLLQSKDADGSYGAVTKLQDGLTMDTPPVRLPHPNESMASYLISGTLRAATPGLVLKKAAFLNIKFNENLIVHEDYDMVIRFAQKYRWCCDPVASVNVHLSATGLSANFDFSSSIAFLHHHASDIEFKWLLFYCFRKISMAYKKKKTTWIKNYMEILEQNLDRASFSYLLNYLLFKKTKKTYLFFFESSVTFAYKLKGIYSRLGIKNK